MVDWEETYDEADQVERRHQVAVGFRAEFGHEAWLLLQQLRQEQHDRYLAAIRSIDNGRADAVAAHLLVWAAESAQANATDLVEVQSDKPAPIASDPVRRVWESITGRCLSDEDLAEFRRKATDLGLYEHATAVLAESATSCWSASLDGCLRLIAWAAEADGVVRRHQRGRDPEIDWRRGSRSAAEQMRRNPTDGERDLAAFLGQGLDGLTFRAQVPLGRYIADFLCEQLPIVIEVDGRFHEGREDRIRREMRRWPRPATSRFACPPPMSGSTQS